MTTPTLPYTIDNTQVPRLTLLGMWAAAPVLLVFLFVLETQGMPEDVMSLLRIALPAFALFDLVGGYFMFRFSKACKGTISRHTIEIQPDTFLGITTTAPGGTYTPAQFASVGVQERSNKGVKFGVITLHGKDATPDISLGTHKLDKVNEIASLLNTELNIARV